MASSEDSAPSTTDDDQGSGDHRAAMKRCREKFRKRRKRMRKSVEVIISSSEDSEATSVNDGGNGRESSGRSSVEGLNVSSDQDEDETAIAGNENIVLNEGDGDEDNVPVPLPDHISEVGDSAHELDSLSSGGEMPPPQDSNSEASDVEMPVEDSESSDEHEASDDTSDSEPDINEFSDENEEEDPNGNENGDQPIYPGAPISLHESLLSIFTLMTTENISGKLLGIILGLISLHCPDGSLVKKTLYSFKKYFKNIGEALLVYHYFCSNCIYPVKLKTSECKHCRKSGNNITFFIELPLLQQLQSLFLRNGFYQDLQFRFRADRKRCPNNIEDIYDGRIYMEQVSEGFLSSPSNVSFMWYSDGVSIFKSSSFSIWPLCMVINELPYKKRTKPENVLLIGLWFGKTKPHPNIFLRPLHKTMQKFEREGHDFKLPDDSVVRVKGKVLCGTCDMPAKCKFLQFKQFNAFNGCPRCMSVGAREAVNTTSVQVYPYEPNVRRRTHEETQQYAQQALDARRTQRDASVHGVKGPTLLSKLVPDVIRCTGIDIMHGVYLGVCKLLMTLWFSSKYSNMPWSLAHMAQVVDEKLARIKPPSNVQRAPRKLKEMKFWKASEYKLFLLYYSIPVLKGVMEQQYFKHHCLLVSAIALLSQDSISLLQIQAASDLLSSYVSDFARLYSLRFLGINVHQLLHLSDVVLDLGPSFVYSCFFLESYNGIINKCFHGTQHVAFQICSTVSMVMQMPKLLFQLPRDTQTSKFCHFLKDGLKTYKIADVIDDLHIAVGKYRTMNQEQVDHSMEVLQSTLNIVTGRCDIFYRLRKSGAMYFSAEYERKSVRNESSYVSFFHRNIPSFGRVIRFVRHSECANLCDVGCRNCPSSFYAIVQIYRRTHWYVHDMRDVRLPFMSKVQRTNDFLALNVQSIMELCFYIEANDEMYVAAPVNRLEVE